MDNQTAGINRLLGYTNQLDPLVPVNNPTFEVWTAALWATDLGSAKQAVMEYYTNLDPSERRPITPGYIRRAAGRIQARKYGKTIMCPDHDWHPKHNCAACRSEIAAGQRPGGTMGESIRQPIPAPQNVVQQFRQILSTKDLNR